MRSALTILAFSILAGCQNSDYAYAPSEPSTQRANFIPNQVARHTTPLAEPPVVPQIGISIDGNWRSILSYSAQLDGKTFYEVPVGTLVPGDTVQMAVTSETNSGRYLFDVVSQSAAPLYSQRHASALIGDSSASLALPPSVPKEQTISEQGSYNIVLRNTAFLAGPENIELKVAISHTLTSEEKTDLARIAESWAKFAEKLFQVQPFTIVIKPCGYRRI